MDNNERNAYNSVRLDPGKCNGCINCLKRCPTGATRLRDGKAHINEEWCIGCGECVRICERGAKLAVCDPLPSALKSDFKYIIALAAPTLLAQFDSYDVDGILSALLGLGFNAVFEVALANELVSFATRRVLREGAVRPLIASSCPAVLKLIQFKYHNLIKYISPVLQPPTVAAQLARAEARKKGFEDEGIGVFYISPCGARATAIKRRGGASGINGVLSQADVYFKIAPALDKAEPATRSRAGASGMSWAAVGGEAKAAECERFLAADGIENVIKVLDQLEKGALPNLEFIELAACPGGCAGGIFNIENPYLARTKVAAVRKLLPAKSDFADYDVDKFLRREPYAAIDLHRLAGDRTEAMRKMMEIERIYAELPHIDCGSCGAPNCRTFAEDVVKGAADRGACRYYNGELKVEN
jgi:ferredoxin